MQYITLAELALWIALTVVVVCIPLYREAYALACSIYAQGKILLQKLFALKPEDLLEPKFTQPEQPLSQDSNDIIPSTELDMTIDQDVSSIPSSTILDTQELTIEINPKEGVAKMEQSRTVTAKIKLTPQDLALHDKLQTLKHSAVLKKDAGKTQEAEKLLIEAQMLGVDDKEVDTLLAGLYFDQGSRVKASSLIKKILGSDGDNHQLIRQLGYIHMQQKDLDAAKHLFQQCIKLKDDKPKYYVSLIDVHIAQESRYDAMYLLEKIHKLRPTNIDYMMSIAMVYEELGDTDAANGWWAKILSIDPLHHIALQKVGK